MRLSRNQPMDATLLSGSCADPSSVKMPRPVALHSTVKSGPASAVGGWLTSLPLMSTNISRPPSSVLPTWKSVPFMVQSPPGRQPPGWVGSTPIEIATGPSLALATATVSPPTKFPRIAWFVRPLANIPVAAAFTNALIALSPTPVSWFTTVSLVNRPPVAKVMSPTFIRCVIPTEQESSGHGAPTNSMRPRGGASLVLESLPLKIRAWTLLWLGSMSQALRCPNRTDPRGEVPTHTGVLASVAAVALAMPVGSQLLGAVSFGQVSLQTLAKEVVSEFTTVHVHAFDSLHCWARLVTLLWTFCPQTFAASLGSPHARSSCVIPRGMYRTVSVAGRPRLALSKAR